MAAVAPLSTRQVEPSGTGRGIGPVPTVLIGGVLIFTIFFLMRSWKRVLKNNDRQEVQEIQQNLKLVEQADSQQMADLFKAFDRNHDGKVDLAELTAGLIQFKPDASADAARSSALDVLLLFDKNDSKVLEKGEFAAFIQSWCLGTKTDFDEMSNELIQRLSDHSFLKDEVQDAIADFQDASHQEVEDLLDRHKLQAIFRLWDTDHDDSVDQTVLEHALKRLVSMSSNTLSKEKREGVKEYMDVMHQTSYIAGQTVDQELVPELTGDGVTTRRYLGPDQFINFIQAFQQISGIPRSQITDFLVILPLYKQTAAEGKPLPKPVKNMSRVLKEHEVLSPVRSAEKRGA
eukprot:jgi/Botrbrau1/19441/Bobra.0338s0063.1